MSGKDPGPSERETAKHLLFDSLRQLCQYVLDPATDYTLLLSLENSDRDCDRMALLGPTDKTVDLAKKIRKEYSNFGVLLDQGHFPLMKEDPDTLSFNNSGEHVVQQDFLRGSTKEDEGI